MRFPDKHLGFAALLFAACGIGGCATTALTSTWRDPAVAQLSFRNVLVLAPTRDPSVRRVAEDELARRIKNAHAVPSYTMIPDTELGDSEAVRARARAAGFDGVVILRVTNVDKQATWVPGAWAGPPYAYTGWAAYDPGYMRVDTYVRVETNVYSLPEDRLVWAAVSRTTNPDSVRSLVKDTAKEVEKEMRREGLLR